MKLGYLVGHFYTEKLQCMSYKDIESWPSLGFVGPINLRRDVLDKP